MIRYLTILLILLNTTFANEDENTESLTLPDDIIPLSYELRIVPKLENFTFTGTVDINLLVKHSNDKIQLHSKNLIIQKCTLKNGTQIIDQKFELNETNHLLIIKTSRQLISNTTYFITIKFEGVMNEVQSGFYKTSYKLDDKERWLATTHFEPTDARAAFPCFDEPRFRTPFTIYLAHNINQTALSNMPPESTLLTNSINDTRVWTKFETTPPMPTYLVAFTISDFVEISNKEKKINLWVRKNAVQQGSYALKQSVKLLQQLETYTGIPYTLPKIDMIALPSRNEITAMEDWGIPSFWEDDIIVNESSCLAKQKSIGTTIITHEFSHMWFGDLATPASWNFLWLKEGFATFFEYFATAAVEPSWRLDHLFITEILHSAFVQEVFTQRAMTTSLKLNDDLNTVYDDISYKKGASVIRMLEHVLSPSTFRKAIHNYLKTRYEDKNRTVTPADLYEAFDEQARRDSIFLPAGVTVSDLMKTWTENIGYPLITVTRDLQMETVTVLQSTYRSRKASEPSPHQQWIVPLTYTTKSESLFSNTKPSQWSFANNVTHLPQKVAFSEWVIFNLQESGYYRVIYDDHTWNLLINQLYTHPKKIHVLNRAQLIDDYFAFATDNIISYNKPLTLIRYLSKETDFIPWLAVIPYINMMFPLYEGLPVYNLISEFLKEIMQKPCEFFGFNIKTTDSHFVKVAKPSFLIKACQLEIGECISKGLAEYKKNENNLTNIQPDLKKVIYCAAFKAHEDKQSVFENIWKEYLNSDNYYERENIISSFSCIKDTDVTKKFLSILMKVEIAKSPNQKKEYLFKKFFFTKQIVNSSIEFVGEKIPSILELEHDDDVHKSVLFLIELLIEIQKRTALEEQIKMIEDLVNKFQLDKRNSYSVRYLAEGIKDICANAREQIAKRNNKAADFEQALRQVLASVPTISSFASSSIST